MTGDGAPNDVYLEEVESDDGYHLVPGDEVVEVVMYSLDDLVSVEEYELEDAPERVEVHFAGTTCEPCPLRSRCPVKLDRRAGAYVLKADLVKVNIERRRRAEATEEWRKRYAIRTGIEGTNSELKRAHGLGRLRVRGGRRVRLAVYLKALACNFKRMVHARLVEMENTAQREVGTVPAVAAA